MGGQMTTIEVDQSAAEILKTLKAKAEAQGVPLASLLRPLAENGSEQTPEQPFYATATPEEWVKAFRQWAASHRTLPYLVDDSRESIYEGRGE